MKKQRKRNQRNFHKYKIPTFDPFIQTASRKGKEGEEEHPPFPNSRRIAQVTFGATPKFQLFLLLP